MNDDSNKIMDQCSSSEELDKKDDLAFNYETPNVPDEGLDFLNE